MNQDSTLHIDRSPTSIDLGCMKGACVTSLPGNHFVFVHGKPSEDWPYQPGILQRRDNSFVSTLNVILLVQGVVKNHEGDFFRTLGQLSKNQIDSLSVLMLKIRRPATPKGVEWNAPGGQNNPDETPEQALARETQEELGLSCITSTILHRNLSFSSGSFREFYNIGVSLAHENEVVKLQASEGILCHMEIGLWKFLEWAHGQNSRSLNGPGYCGVDGKVVLAITTLINLIKR